MTYPFVNPWEQGQSGTPHPPRIPGVPEGGPLAGMQDSIASALNAAQDSYVSFPTPGPGSPIVSVPRRFPAYRQGYAPAGQPVRLGPVGKLVLLVVVVAALTAVAFLSGAV